MHLALFEPEIAGNVGAALRLAACLDTPLHIIEPCGFPFSVKAVRRSGMDYVDRADIRPHVDFTAFDQWRRAEGHRLLLLSTRTKVSHLYTDVAYRDTDILVVGRESSGASEAVHNAADMRVIIPMAEGTRSLNMAVSLAMVAGENLRQTRWCN